MVLEIKKYEHLKKKNYSIIIGDSFVEGVGLAYDDTLTAILNKKLSKKEFEKFEFLNAEFHLFSIYIQKNNGCNKQK